LLVLRNAEFGIRIAEGESKDKESGNRKQESGIREDWLPVASCRLIEPGTDNGEPGTENRKQESGKTVAGCALQASGLKRDTQKKASS
jgi:hypothetical protein